MAKVISRIPDNQFIAPEFKTDYGWTNLYTGDAIEYMDDAAADVQIALEPSGYGYTKSNPIPGGPHRPK